MKKMILIAMTLLLFVVMAACGTEEKVANGKEEKVEVVEEKVESEVEVVEERVIEHLLGDTVIKGQPEKIATLMPWLTDYLLSLDITPYAAVSAGPNLENFTWYLEEGLKDVKNLGWAVNNVNLELLLSIEPDLIIGNKAFDKAYEDLSKIAPTIVLETKENEDGVKDMRQTFLSVAQVLDKEDKAKEAIKDYDAFVQDAREKVSAAIGDETVMFLRVHSKELRYYGAKNYDVLYNDLGVQPPAHFPDNSSTFAPLSFEMLPEINPDHIFLLVESEEKLEEVKQTPLWEGLTAVQKDQVYPVDYALWFQGFGPIANKLIIEEALEKLTK